MDRIRPSSGCLIAIFALFLLPGSEWLLSAQEPRVANPAAHQRTDEAIAALNEAVKARIREEFGTWDAPRQRDDLPIDIGDDDPANGHKVGWRMAQGHAVYEEHCARCHGEQGDGNGPDAEGMNPPPRDFRPGQFKWKSTVGWGGHPASTRDLQRTVKNGLPGTSMPAHPDISDDEIAAVVDFVRWIGITGQIERRLSLMPDEVWLMRAVGRKESALREDASELHEDLDFLMTEVVRETLEDSAAADDDEIVLTIDTAQTPDTAASRARGREVFINECARCHGESGAGDGEVTQTVYKDSFGHDEPGLYDNWGNPLRPADFTTREFRGGDRPEDIYRRIAVGIPGTPMIAFDRVLEEKQIWDLVNYVLSLREE